MARLGPFAPDRSIVAAVSGGADSMALAFLLARWGRPLAAIVDHGLRAESGSEAALTAERLARIGIPARILRARLAPGPAAAARARAARYRLLLEACRDAGCADLAIAHHATDQAETVRMREAAGSATDGLSGMAAIAYRAEARLLRPLLPLPPARLRATLRAAAIDWVEDPTNADPRTLRARLRQAMDPAAIARDLQTAARAVSGRGDADLAAELASVRFHPEGFALISTPIGDQALSAVIWTLSGRDYPPPRTAVAAALAAGLAPCTVHGVRLGLAGRLGPGAIVFREASAMAAPQPAIPGTLWDRRFRIGAAPDGLTIGALGPDAPRFRNRAGLPSAVLRTLPALRRDGHLTIVPHLAFPDATSCRSVTLWFAPARPAAGAAFR